ncbi:MAG: helix-turn-helix transcriptional regulator [Clostridia bacterium]|nr:helix-turn-helix transcriptional regulator [Clostridia bacterium]
MGRFHDNLQKLLDSRGITFAELSRQTGISKNGLSYWRSQDIIPSSRTLKRITDYLGIEKEDLLAAQNEELSVEEMTIIERISFELDKRRLAGSKLSEYLGTSNAQFAAWKRRSTDPPAKYMPKIAHFLGVSLEYLLTGIDSELSGESKGVAYSSSGDEIELSPEEMELARLRANDALTQRIKEVVEDILKST